MIDGQSDHPIANSPDMSFPAPNDTTSYYPFPWVVTPVDEENASCPSIPHVLTTFAAINGIVGISTFLLGHRSSVHWLSCGWLGGQNQHTYLFMWIFTTGLSLAANALNAMIVKKQPGYETGFSIAQLTLFYAVRPRITLRLSTFFIISPNIADGAWTSFAYTHAISEINLQLIGSYTLGSVLAWSSQHHGAYKHMMYLAAAFWMVIAYLLLLANGLELFFSAGKQSRRGYDPLIMAKHPIFTVSVIFAVLVIYTLNWLFWVGFLELAGNGYCPPQLDAQGVVWTLFSMAGVAFGG